MDDEKQAPTADAAPDVADEVREYDVYEDADGREFIEVDGERLYLDEDDTIVAEEAEAVEEYDVYEDADGREFVIIDGQHVYLDEGGFEVREDDEDENPFAYDTVQAATDVANTVAREGASIAREGAELAGELKEAMDDITGMLDIKNWFK